MQVGNSKFSVPFPVNMAEVNILVGLTLQQCLDPEQYSLDGDLFGIVNCHRHQNTLINYQ